MPRAGAIVPQGGGGTTGQALRSGKPPLGLAHAHDQFDNGARVERAGCGRVLSRPRYNADTAFAELRRVLDEPGYRSMAVDIGRRGQNENGAAAAADALQQALNTLT